MISCMSVELEKDMFVRLNHEMMYLAVIASAFLIVEIVDSASEHPHERKY